MAEERSKYAADLDLIRENALERLPACADTQFAAIANALMNSSERLDAYEGGGQKRETALSEFQKRLAERQSAPKSSRKRTGS